MTAATAQESTDVEIEGAAHELSNEADPDGRSHDVRRRVDFGPGGDTGTGAPASTRARLTLPGALFNRYRGGL